MQWVVLSGQDSLIILPARVANQNAGFDPSCPLMELAYNNRCYWLQPLMTALHVYLVCDYNYFNLIMIKVWCQFYPNSEI